MTSAVRFSQLKLVVSWRTPGHVNDSVKVPAVGSTRRWFLGTVRRRWLCVKVRKIIVYWWLHYSRYTREGNIWMASTWSRSVERGVNGNLYCVQQIHGCLLFVYVLFGGYYSTYLQRDYVLWCDYAYKWEKRGQWRRVNDLNFKQISRYGKNGEKYTGCGSFSATYSPPLKGSPSREQREVIIVNRLLGKGGSCLPDNYKRQRSKKQRREITERCNGESKNYGAGSVSSETWGSL